MHADTTGWSTETLAHIHRLEQRWKAASAALDRAANPTQAMADAEQAAYDDYSDLMDSLYLCNRIGCMNTTSDNVLCEQHRTEGD